MRLNHQNDFSLIDSFYYLLDQGLSAPEGSVREKRQAPGIPGGYCCYDIRGPIWSTGGTGDRGYLESDSSTQSRHLRFEFHRVFDTIQDTLHNTRIPIVSTLL